MGAREISPSIEQWIAWIGGIAVAIALCVVFLFSTFETVAHSTGEKETANRRIDRLEDNVNARFDRLEALIKTPTLVVRRKAASGPESADDN